jgi:uncharacterized protein (DUF169 family)
MALASKVTRMAATGKSETCDRQGMTPASTQTTWAAASTGDLADALRTVLLLDCAPVGVGLIRSAEEFASCRFPSPKEPLHYCAAVKTASEGASLKLANEHMACMTAPRALGLAPGLLEPEFVESYLTDGLYTDRSQTEALLSEIRTPAGVVGVAVAPLAAFSETAPPDVVIVATLPYGAMRVAQATTFAGSRVRGDVIGMHGLCAESTAAPASTGAVCTSLLCSGSRHEAGWDEHLLSIGIPFELLPAVVEGLVRTAERYETDERKARMRSSCCSTGAAAGFADDVAALTDRGAYFHE